MDDRAEYYSIDGEPIDHTTWRNLFELEEYKRVASDEGDGWRVSTVWLGVDHNFWGEGPPLIFETMVFGGPLEHEQVRYSTLAQATAGHAEMVERVRHAMSVN